MPQLTIVLPESESVEIRAALRGDSFSRLRAAAEAALSARGGAHWSELLAPRRIGARESLRLLELAAVARAKACFVGLAREGLSEPGWTNRALDQRHALEAQMRAGLLRWAAHDRSKKASLKLTNAEREAVGDAIEVFFRALGLQRIPTERSRIVEQAQAAAGSQMEIAIDTGAAAALAELEREDFAQLLPHAVSKRKPPP
jgi:hypothetical protein